MCQSEGKCQKPENLKGAPGDCSPEQIKKCHGDVTEHPCCQPQEATKEESSG